MELSQQEREGMILFSYEPPEEPEADMPYICPYCELDCTVDKYGNVNCIDCGEFRLKDYDNWDEDL